MMHVWTAHPGGGTWHYEGRMSHAQVIAFMENALPDSMILPGVFAVPEGVFYFVMPAI